MGILTPTASAVGQEFSRPPESEQYKPPKNPHIKQQNIESDKDFWNDLKAPKPLKSEPTPQKIEPVNVPDSVREEYLGQQLYREPDDRPKQPTTSKEDRVHEETGKRTESSRTFQNRDGSTTTEISAAPTAYKDGNSYKDLGKTVREDTAYQEAKKVDESIISRIFPGSPQPVGFTNNQGPMTTQFKTFRDGDGVTVKAEGKQLHMRPLEANDDIKPTVKREKDTDKITYKNVWQDVDLVYEYRGDHIKEYLVIKKAVERRTYKFEFSGATLRFNEKDPNVVDVLLNGKSVFQLPALTVNVNKKGFVDGGAKYVINGDTVTVQLDGGFVNGLDNQDYPVVVDPAVIIDSHQSSHTMDSTYMHAYRDNGPMCGLPSCPANVGVASGPTTWRSMLRIPIDQAVGKTLLSATMYADKIPNGGSGWYGDTTTHRYWVTWAECFGYNCVGNTAPWLPIDIGASGQADMKDLIAWMAANQPSGWIYIFGDTGGYKGLDPYSVQLHLTYNTPPPAPSAVDPVSNSIINTTMPKLKANPVTDADGDTVSYSVSIYNGATFIATSGPLSVPTWTVPDGLLEDGNTYTWKAASMDPWIWTWNAGSKFTIDLRTDKDKTQTYDDVGPFSINLADGNAYTSVGSHSVGALGGNIGIGLDYNTPTKSIKGLSAWYYNDTSQGRILGMTRTDPNLDFEWGVGSPNPGAVQDDNFAANWRGYFVAPQTGTYKFGGLPDDEFSLAIDVNQNGTFETGELQFDITTCCSQQWSSGTVSLTEGQAYEVNAWAIEHGGSAMTRLLVRLPNTPTTDTIIPQDYLRSLAKQDTSKQGLMARYYYDSGSHTFPTNQQPYYTQRHQQVNAKWGTGSSVPYDRYGIYTDHFLVRFSGYVTIPTTGTYSFGSGADDGQRVYVNGNNVASKWYDHSYEEAWSTGMFFTAGQVVPIVLEYYDNTGSAEVNLLWNGPAGAGVIPTQFLSTSYNNLPIGWDLSVDADGNLPYERLRTTGNGNADLIDGDGTRHTYTWTGTGFKPPADEAGVLTRNPDNTFTLQDSDGRVYQFSSEGTLLSVTTPTDDRKPAALKYDYQDNGGVPRLKKVIDGVDTSRFGEIFYGGESQCVTPSGFNAAPTGFVCAFETYDGQKTNFYYMNEKLSRIELPGGQVTDIANDAEGRITSVRDPLASDAVAASVRTDDATVRTENTYDKLGRASKVKAPAPTASASRQEHTFEYGYGKSKRHITGATEPNGYMQYVEYDSKQRTTKVCDIAALCTTTEWHADKDLVLSATDATGLKSTTIYDYADRPVHQYGPAPSSWFDTNREPLSTYTSQVPHSETAYDEGMQGLETAFYTYTTASKTLTGTPKLRSTGIGTNFAANWGGTQPITPDTNPNSTTNWGLRATGYIELPQTGTYSFRFHSDDGVRLYIDDQLVSEDWNNGAPRSHASGTYNNTVAGKKRIAIEYYAAADSNNDAILELYMTAPGGTEVTVPGTALLPGYGLATTAKSYDSTLGNTTATTNYGSNPELGLAQSSSVDPTGLNLTASSTYETPGATGSYIRQLTKNLPGNPSNNPSFSYTYYGATETRDNPCTTGVTEAFKQAGFMKFKTEADPDGTGSQTPRKTETIYDNAGRVVASRYNNDSWTCSTYDTRSRLTQTVIPAFGSEPGRTITNVYAVSSNPLQTATYDGNGWVITTADLLGRTVNYTDAYGDWTGYEYNALGQLTRKFGDMGEEIFYYDTYNRLANHLFDGVTYATVYYDPYGRADYIDYNNAGQMRLTFGRDTLGRPNSKTYRMGNGTTTISDTVTRTQTGRVTTDVVASGGNQLTYNYGYDAAGRLTSANTSGYGGTNSYAYGFGTQNTTTCGTGTGTNPNSGKNSNRTSQTINGVTTYFCYDYADRLTSSSNPLYSNPTYDSHGNMTTLGTYSTTPMLGWMGYDSSDRNTGFEQYDNTGNGHGVYYDRSVHGRIIARYHCNIVAWDWQCGGNNQYYSFTSEGDAPDFVRDDNWTIVEKHLQLPGGVLLTVKPTQTGSNQKQYSLSGTIGHTLLTANAAGTNTSNGNGPASSFTYDPFGNPLPSSVLPANTAYGSYGFGGAHQRLAEVDLMLAPIQMGARVYLSVLGRFASVDPISGGTENSYVYPTDPVNGSDYSGMVDLRKLIARIGAGAMAVGAAAVAGTGIAVCVATVACGIGAGIAIGGAAATSVAFGGIAVSGRINNPTTNVAGTIAMLGLSVGPLKVKRPTAQPKINVNPLSGTTYTPKVLLDMQRDKYHGFPISVDRLARTSDAKPIVGGDGIQRTQVRIQGSMNGRGGYYEYIIEPDNTINHRFFQGN